ncbi:MAG: hypothetical protein QOF70_6625 [Acetobacteraceae bacterium]|jgi:hypothetical protein|nr:uncharacterized protein [Rhodopila sp.]MEA2732150.1 hypothetical protein [Acetobacteraceae bacterium]
MTHFNIVHILPDGDLNLRAYHEVIDSVRWGLQQLGHETTYSVNEVCQNARNIIFGGHRAPDVVIGSPEHTIYYNLEQIRGSSQFDPNDPHPLVTYISSNLHVWEYSGANLASWNALGPKHPIKHVPISYAPGLTHIKSAEKQDIDILIYGSVGERRLSVFSSVCDLANAGISTVFACGLWGADRDSLIARAKIVLNVNHLTERRILEIARVSYLMANSKAIVADVSADTYIESDIVDGIIFVPIDDIAETCCRLLADEPRRTQLERQGFACITQRDIRKFLAAALA